MGIRKKKLTHFNLAVSVKLVQNKLYTIISFCIRSWKFNENI